MPTGVYERTAEMCKARRGKPSWNKGKKHSESHRKALSLNHADVRLEKNPFWNGGKMRIASGYILLRVTNHPFANIAGYIYEHRLVMETHLGCYLTAEEVVHHINGIKDDNRIENLMLFASKSEHQKFHWKLKKENSKLLARQG